MKDCKFCQAEINDEDRVCPVCGKEQDAAAQSGAVETAPQDIPGEDAAQEEAAVAFPAEEAAVAEFSEEESAPEDPPAGEAPAEEAPAAQAHKVSPGKLALATAAVVVLAALLIALVMAGMQDAGTAAGETAAPELSATQPATEVTTAPTTPATIPADGNPDDVTCKGSYTVDDETARNSADVVVATMGGMELTNSQLQPFYWLEVQGFLSNYSAYAAYFGLDYTQPLDTQVPIEEGYNTWQQFFLDVALQTWQQYQALALEAQAAGLSISAEDQAFLDGLEASLTETAGNYGVTLDELIRSNVGPGATLEDFIRYQELYHHGITYYEHRRSQMVPSDEELEAFYAQHEAEYLENQITKDALLVDVRHILIMPEGGATGEDGATTYSDEEWAAAEAQAQQLLDQWLAGEQTQDSFAALAREHSQDGGSQANGGLYENVYTGQMVQAFNDWSFDPSRQTGDYGLVKTEYGYHIMYFVDSRPMWRQYAQSDWLSEQTNLMLEETVAAHPATIHYDKIVLGDLELG